MRNDPKTLVFEIVCIRATLDAFWSRASRTIKGHLSEVRFSLKYARMAGILDPLPRLGPYPLYYHGGVLQAIMVCLRAMEPASGRDGKVKYGTARKTRATYTVLWNVSPESGTDLSFSAAGKGQVHATLNPAEGRFYERFALGCGARLGDVVKQDRAYLIKVLLKLLEMYEAEYQEKGFSMSHN